MFGGSALYVLLNVFLRRSFCLTSMAQFSLSQHDIGKPKFLLILLHPLTAGHCAALNPLSTYGSLRQLSLGSGSIFFQPRRPDNHLVGTRVATRLSGPDLDE